MSKFIIPHPGFFGSSKTYNRNEGKWIYCIHPAWTNNNDSLRRACDRANTYLNIEIENNDLDVMVWGLFNKKIAKEFDVVINEDTSIFIAVRDGQIICHNESLTEESICDWINKVFRVKEKIIELHDSELKKEIKELKQDIDISMMSRFKKLF